MEPSFNLERVSLQLESLLLKSDPSGNVMYVVMVRIQVLCHILLPMQIEYELLQYVIQYQDRK